MKTAYDIIAGIILLAILAVILSPNAKTKEALQTAFSSFNRILGVVVSPISKAGE